MSATWRRRTWLCVLAVLALAALAALELRRRAHVDDSVLPPITATEAPSNDAIASSDADEELDPAIGDVVVAEVEPAMREEVVDTSIASPKDLIVVRGRVVDEHDAGLASADVRLEIVREGSRTTAHGRVDEHGAFFVAGPPLGRFTLVASAAGRTTERVDLGPLAAGDERANLVVRLLTPPSARIVVRWPDGSFALGADVELFELVPSAVVVDSAIGLDSPDDSRPARVERATRSIPRRVARGRADVSGTFTATLNAKTSYRVVAHGTRPLDATLGADVVHACGLDVGDRAVTSAASVEGTWPPSEDVALVLRPRAYVVGRVTDAHGAPIAHARVVRRTPLDELARRPGTTARTAKDGTYLVDDLPASAVDLEVRANGSYADASFRCDGTKAIERRDLVLERLSTVEGVALDPSGAPREGVNVELRMSGSDVRVGVRTPTQPGSETPASSSRLGRDTTMLRTMRTTSNGRFRFEDVPSGWIRLDARDDRLVVLQPFERRLEREEDALGVELHLDRAANVHGRARMEDSSPLGHATVRESPIRAEQAPLDGGTDDDGMFEIRGLAPGTWTFQVELPWVANVQAEATVELEAGKTHEVELIVRR